MSYRPYPDVRRALHQLERHRTPASLKPSSWISTREIVHAEDFAAAWRKFGASVTESLARHAGKLAMMSTIVDQAVEAGEYVHVAGRDGVQCAGGDPACSLPSKQAPRCPGCGHAQHVPGAECEGVVEHGPNRLHRCLCLAMPGASRACPTPMHCQGGPLGYADVVHLRHGRILRGPDGQTITPDVLAEGPS